MFDRGFGAIARPGRAWALAGVLVLALLAIIPQTQGTAPLLPALQDRNLLLHVQALPGTSLAEMDRITAAAGNELQSLPGVKSVGTHVGRAVGSDQLTDVNSAEVWITLDDRADYARTKAAITTVMHGYPGLRTDLVTYPGDRIGQVTADQRDDLVVRVYGADLGMLQHKAGDVRAMLTRVPGVADPVVRPVPQQPTVAVKVNLAAAQKYGLRPGDIRRDATTLTSGLIVGNLYEQSKIFDVVVWGAPQTRSDLTELGNMLIDTPAGGQVGLKDVASLTVRAEPGRHRARRRARAAWRWPPASPATRPRWPRPCAPRSRGCRCRTSTTRRCSAAPRPEPTRPAGWPRARSRWSASSCCCRRRWAAGGAPG